MIPLYDNIPARGTPWVNYTLIGICGAVFAIQLIAGSIDARSVPEGPRLEERFGMIPARVARPDRPLTKEVPGVLRGRPVLVEVPIAPTPIPAWLTLVTCVFLHGGWLHFLGNMWSLWIFGDNVEDRLGHVGYLMFWLAAGIVASLSHLLSDPNSAIPTIGASGAIAGVMGAYLLLYPRALVVTLIPLGPILQSMAIPAPAFLGIWFVLQLVQGFATAGGAVTGVAWWAHIGGFVLGFLAAALLRAVGETSPPVEERRGTDRAGRFERRDSDFRRRLDRRSRWDED